MKSVEKSRINTIIDLHNQIIGHFRKSVELGIKIGELLVGQKESLKYGEFINWINSNLPFTDRTARRYIMLYQNRDRFRSDIMSEAKLTQCYRLLSDNIQITCEIDNTKSNNGSFSIVYAEDLKRKRLKNGIEVNRVYFGDAAIILQQFPNNCIDLVITSPPLLRPYSGQVFDLEVFSEVARQLVRVIKHGAVIVWLVGSESVNGSESLTPFKHAIYFVEQCNLILHDHMIYEKNSPSFYSGENSVRYSQVFEHVFIFSKGGQPKTINLLRDRINKLGGQETSGTKKWRDKNNRRKCEIKKYVISHCGVRNNIWHYYVGAGISTKEDIAHRHPAMPDLLALDHIRSWSNEGNVVLDPFCGSGTVLAMARASGRNYVGIETSQEYLGIIEDRLNCDYDYGELVENSFRHYNKISKEEWDRLVEGEDKR